MIGSAFSLLIRLELASPGVQFLQGDHQLFNGAPFHFIVRCDNDYTEISQAQPNPLTPYESLSLKASILASTDQPDGDNSMIEKPIERISASYSSYDEDNESLQLSMLVEIPGTVNRIFNSFSEHHILGLLLYIKILDLIWSDGQVTRSNLKEGRHLREPIGGQYKNSGSPDR
jgi:hypothetical protein